MDFFIPPESYLAGIRSSRPDGGLAAAVARSKFREPRCRSPIVPIETALLDTRESAERWRACAPSHKITCPRSQLESRLLFCPVFFGGDPEARPLCPPQRPDRRQ